MRFICTREGYDVQAGLYSLFLQSYLSVSLSLSHFCNICPDPMEIIIIKEREREREEKQIDDEAEEKAINASQKKRGSLEEELGGERRKGFLIVLLYVLESGNS